MHGGVMSTTYNNKKRRNNWINFHGQENTSEKNQHENKIYNENTQTEMAHDWTRTHIYTQKSVDTETYWSTHTHTQMQRSQICRFMRFSFASKVSITLSTLIFYTFVSCCNECVGWRRKCHLTAAHTHTTRSLTPTNIKVV